ncbi:MAG TPA: hypothetical protein P5186_25370 [Candidatus Paceibacterota bacterium]|nr:hypothetical protein [Verrucomicrobiota bacterium]HRY51395.1 hypothetical protein [Candidatus Paceibacterota bacterium]HSA00124.1 hypothetical protein [Candidatus Paceibacterota bacterium]
MKRLVADTGSILHLHEAGALHFVRRLVRRFRGFFSWTLADLQGPDNWKVPVVIPAYAEVPVFVIRLNLKTAGLTREDYFRSLDDCMLAKHTKGHAIEAIQLHLTCFPAWRSTGRLAGVTLFNTAMI